MIEISASAQTYLQGLLSKQDDDDVSIRIFVAQPGTPQAETCIAYCRPGEEQDGDIAVEYAGFRAWFEGRSEAYLEDAQVDYQEDQMGGQLTIKAPNARVPKVGPDAPIEDRINYVLYNEINPGLAAHGGNVSLVEVTPETKAVLQFGGGCQGCSAVDITLKSSVETTLLEQVPELTGVIDHTDHTVTENAYYS
ncbi:Fe-S biogenesis protein NfuA [Pseudomonadales bacterium]|jgi:Fe/S biogenesis protein NfuA|nr:Fe-S biogenesis protein NfuA [Gammaproteobacteria bacterium]MDA7785001.1 Fe-S biogenesis protein NfuA [Pseudomonadales bacterium]MBT5681471.1 Fe-S biogenesis protein NfuA [Gammaproteobacteria bacterium]MBT6025721.1 Fe-S biogenesis protein NfuA [Gammaproteobacteria bacterium]MDA9256452.1 Fe-S biogenesis protein NfuA [Pseudomonadales bacterium]|tara:strand:+ start:112 stop:693 length:582 start_codon:yes stop_codon:yes gene_type:complete